MESIASNRISTMTDTLMCVLLLNVAKIILCTLAKSNFMKYFGLYHILLKFKKWAKIVPTFNTKKNGL